MTGIVFVGSLFLALALFREAWANPSRTTVGIGEDTIHNISFGRWFAGRVLNGQSPWIVTSLGAPTGQLPLLWNGAPLPVLLLYPVTTLWGPIASYNLAVTLALPINVCAALFAMRRFVTHERSAVIGAVLYGFSPPVIAHALGHLNLTFAWFPAVVLLLAHEVLVAKRWSRARVILTTAVVLLMQLLCSGEQLAMTVLGVVIAGACWLVANPATLRLTTQRLREAAPTVGLAAVAGAVVTAWPLAKTYGSFHFDGPARGPTEVVNDWWGLVTPIRTAQAWRPYSIERITNEFVPQSPAEWNGYLGFALVFLIPIVIAIGRRDRVARWSAVCGAAFLVFSFGPRLRVRGVLSDFPLPWAIVAKVPLLHHVLAARIGLLAWLFVALLLASHIDRRWWRRRVSYRSPVAGACAVAVGVTLMPTTSFWTQARVVPAFFEDDVNAMVPVGSTIVMAPYPRPGMADAMLWQAFAGMRFRMPGGYYNSVDGQGRLEQGPQNSVLTFAMQQVEATGVVPAADSYTVQRSRADLLDLEASHVIVGPTRPPEREGDLVSFFETVVGAKGVSRGRVTVWTLPPSPAQNRPVRARFGDGFFGDGITDGSLYRWAGPNPATIQFDNPRAEPTDVVVSGRLIAPVAGTLRTQSQTAALVLDTETAIGPEQPWRLALRVPPGRSRIVLTRDAVGRLPDDPRDWRWAIINPRVDDPGLAAIP